MHWTRLRLYSVVVVGVVLIDQLTKAAALRWLPTEDRLTFFWGSLVLTRAYNSGAFLSLGGSLPDPVREYLFTLGVLAIVVVLTVYAVRTHNPSKLMLVATAMTAGGGLANLIDRVRYDGYVFDFLNVGIGSLRTGVFNVADMFILAGVGCMLVGGRERHTIPTRERG